MISIVIPAYNVEHSIKKCVDSILCQKYKEIEIIIVEDCSTDNTRQVIKTINHPNVRLVLLDQNGGLSNARNIGADCAEGEYLLFLDSDDYMVTDSLKIIDAVLKNYKPDLIFGSFDRVDSNGRIIQKKCVDFDKGMYTSLEMLEKVADRSLPTYAWNIVINRKIYVDNKIIFPVGRRYEDMSTIVKLINCCDRIYYTDETTYAYSDNPNSISRKPIKKDAYDIISSVDEMKDIFEKVNLANSQMDKFYCYYADTYLFAYRTIVKSSNSKSEKKIFREKTKKLFKSYTYTIIKNSHLKFQWLLFHVCLLDKIIILKNILR